MKLPISIGILSWRSKTTLRNTLESYKRNGLLDIVNDARVFFQEFTEADLELAREYNIPYIATSSNVGIGKAFVALAEESVDEYFLPLEHDWALIENESVTRARLESSIRFLERGFSGVRLRSRWYPGIPLYSVPAYQGRELEHRCPVTGKLSPHLMDCIHWINNPDERFPDKIQKDGEFYVSTSRWSCWTNNPCLFRRSFYLETVAPFVGDPLLEPAMSKWWSDQTFKIAYGSGLFTHKDPDKYPAATS